MTPQVKTVIGRLSSRGLMNQGLFRVINEWLVNALERGQIRDEFAMAKILGELCEARWIPADLIEQCSKAFLEHYSWFERADFVRTFQLLLRAQVAILPRKVGSEEMLWDLAVSSSLFQEFFQREERFDQLSVINNCLKLGVYPTPLIDVFWKENRFEKLRPTNKQLGGLLVVVVISFSNPPTTAHATFLIIRSIVLKILAEFPNKAAEIPPGILSFLNDSRDMPDAFDDVNYMVVDSLRDFLICELLNTKDGRNFRLEDYLIRHVVWKEFSLPFVYGLVAKKSVEDGKLRFVKLEERSIGGERVSMADAKSKLRDDEKL